MSKVWVTRDKDDGDGVDDSCVVITESKPTLKDNGLRFNHKYGKDDDFDMYIGIVNFRKKFHYTPRKGTCVQKELIFKRR